ncbi:MAG: ABC transporter permease, partial [Gemmatimonadales bacterium]
MTSLPDGWRRLFRIWRRSAARDVDAELAFHFDERIAELVEGGMSSDQARRVAGQEFGDLATVRRGLVAIDGRIARHGRQREWWQSVGQDAWYVARVFRRSPGFLAAVALTLALGIGVNTAIFSILDRLYLQPPPGVVRPGEIRRIIRIDRAPGTAKADRPRSVLVYTEFRDLAAVRPKGVALAGFTDDVAQFGRGTDAVTVGAVYVIGDYFGALGVTPALGRFFSPDELGIDGAASVVVIGRRFWQTRFGGRGDAIGQIVSINGRRYTVIGVIRGAFHGADINGGDVWLPLGAERWTRGGAAEWFRGTAMIQTLVRVGSGETAAQVVSTAANVFRSVTEFGADSSATAGVEPLVQASLFGPGVSIAARLAVISWLILLIACANVANLLLARGMQRRREIAVRLALGVSRRRLIRLLLMESGAAAACGGVIAIGVAFEGAALLRHLLMPEIRWADATINLHVLAFTLMVALLAGVGAGAIPALKASRPDLVPALKAGARGDVLHRTRIRAALVVVQAALSVLLLAGAGLLIRSLRNVEAIDTGYASRQIVFASIEPDPDHRARRPEIATRLPNLATSLEHLSGVEAVGVTSDLPMYALNFEDLFLPGHDSLPTVNAEGPYAFFVSPSYLTTMGVRLVRGRVFEAADRFGDGAPVLVNETMARAYWPGTDALGQCVILDARKNGCSTVIGVVSNTHARQIIEPKPAMQFYVPLADTCFGQAGVIALRAGDGRTPLVVGEVRRALDAEFGGWAIPHVRVMFDYIDSELQPWRAGALLFSVAGLLALLVAIVGIYSTISYTFSQRTHEIGVRMALGARPATVLRLVVGSGVRMVFIGVMIGMALALAAGRFVASMLYRTSPH